MEHTNDGLTLIYDIPEAPIPQGIIAQSSDISITAKLKPICPSNVVTINNNVNGRSREPIRANPGAIDYKENAQYFNAKFPALKPGEVANYAVIGRCAGRQVPNPEIANELLHSFRIDDASKTITRPLESRLVEQSQPLELPRFQLDNEFLARVTITIESQRIIGPTPEGIRVTWNAKRGTFAGPKIRGKLLQGADWMRIRPDGIGNLDVRAIVETEDDVKIMTTYTGVLEWGEDGYQRFLEKNYPKPLKAWTTQRFLTADSKYSWLNRHQCIGIGEVYLDEQTYIYDAYVLR